MLSMIFTFKPKDRAATTIDVAYLTKQLKSYSPIQSVHFLFAGSAIRFSVDFKADQMTTRRADCLNRKLEKIVGNWDWTSYDWKVCD